MTRSPSSHCITPEGRPFRHHAGTDCSSQLAHPRHRSTVLEQNILCTLSLGIHPQLDSILDANGLQLAQLVFWTSLLTNWQRASSSAAGAESASSPFHLTATASVATAAAIGSAAWYYHLYGQDVFAAAPAEEG